jgi:hypothetical protein
MVSSNVENSLFSLILNLFLLFLLSDHLEDSLDSDKENHPTTPTTSGQPVTPVSMDHLMKRVEKYRKRSNRLRRKLDSVTNTPKSARSSQARKENSRKQDLAAAKAVLKEHVSGDVYHLMVAQLTHSVRKNRKKWSKELKLYCLALYYKSPAAHKFLRKTFAIPSKRTLQRMVQNVKSTCGFVDEFFTMLKTNCSTMDTHKKLCAISFDEMALAASLSYDSGNDKILGFEDFGDIGSTKKIANHALVFMASGLISGWKQPLGFFASRSATPGNVLKPLLFECLSRVTAAGLIPKCIIADMGPCNQSLFKSLGVTYDKPWFMFGSEKILVFFDPPHLLKSLRNNLHAHDFIVEGKRVSWKHIRKMYELD